MTPGALLCPGTGGDLSTFLGAWWGVLAGFPYQPGPTLLDTGRRWKEATTGRECDHRNTAQRQKAPAEAGAPVKTQATRTWVGKHHCTGGSSFLSHAGSTGSSVTSSRVRPAETPTTVAPTPTVWSTPMS